MPLDSPTPKPNPAQHLLAKLEGIPLPVPTGWNVLVLQYIRPDKIGSILMADTSKQEDQWQSRMGLVMAIGPDCYKDPARYPNGPWCQVGDWIMWPKLENAATRFSYNGVTLAVIPDDRVVAVGIDPLKALG